MIEFRRRTIVTNKSGVTQDFVRKRLEDDESFEIIDRDINVWRDEPTISGAISSGDLLVSNGLKTFFIPAEGEFWFYGQPHSPVGSLQTGGSVVLPNDATGAITLSGVGLVTVDPLSSDTIHISAPDAASLFQLSGVSGTLASGIATLSGVVSDNLDFLVDEVIPNISSPATTVQGGFTAFDEALSTTTATTFQNKLTLSADTTVVFTGTGQQPFRLSWYYEWGYSSASSEIETQITVDNLDVVGTIQWSPSSTNSDDFAASSGYADMTLNVGDHTFDIDYRSTANGKTSRIQRCRLALSPMTLGPLEQDPPVVGNP
jgi:hypothetical protein